MVTLCPAFREHGICPNPACIHSHELFPCELCHVAFTERRLLDEHLRSKPHRKRVNTHPTGGIAVGYCELCDNNTILGVWETHKRGRRHRELARKSSVDPLSVVPKPPKDIGGFKFVACDACDVLVHLEQLAQHERSGAHRNGLSFTALRNVLNEAAQDRNGVSLSHEDGVDFGLVEAAHAVQGLRIDVQMTTAPGARIRVVAVRCAERRAGAGSFTVITASGGLNSNDTVIVTLKQSMLGEYDDRLEVVFEDLAVRLEFTIARDLRATVVGSREVHELLKPVSPYIQRLRVTDRDREVVALRGVPPPIPKTLLLKAKRLPLYEIPKPLNDILAKAQKELDATIFKIRMSYLPSVLNGESYGQHWKALLWAEEHRAELDLQIFDIDDAILEKSGGGFLYWLRVPGLAEKRPSVLRGDRMHVQPRNTRDAKSWFEGHVHEVAELRVGLRFNNKFPVPSPAQPFEVRFKLNRTPLRRQHQALEQDLYRSDRVLFPKAEHLLPPLSQPVQPGEVHLFNEHIVNNQSQLDAVMAILNLPEGSPPFALFGPPGTGKTVTLVEAALQVITQFPNFKLLVTAPSNSAADLVAQRLSAVLRPDALFRLYGRSRQKKDVPENLLPYTLVDGTELDIPPLEKLTKYRVVVCTCVSAAVPYNLGIPPGYFNGIFVDEAGQATEPEVMIPIKTMADDKTNIVLAGDPKQLGPVIRSMVARRLGLEKSYLQRLMDSQDNLYDPHEGHGRTVVKLVQNYRSHEAILTFPNQEFYDNELVPCAPAVKRNACIGASVLVNKHYPVVFHAIVGSNERESTSPSYFNILEAEQVKRYIDELIADKRINVRYEDIGVIAPYHAQVLKIRKLLREKGKEGARKIKVGSVEEFQGQERKVIFVSTTRSSRELVAYDLKHTLGFVANPRRFNVAVTRAQALLIIVGNPNVLSLDPLWRRFLNSVHQNDGWRGPSIPWDPEDEVDENGEYDAQARASGAAEITDLANRMRGVEIGGEEEAAEDKPFREVE
ncbi:unnamed protein product [Peniophora sp. CBMAI 1063]|nr:unnamed protein product [Peniophora sp. CBMAI 1063]